MDQWINKISTKNNYWSNFANNISARLQPVSGEFFPFQKVHGTDGA